MGRWEQSAPKNALIVLVIGASALALLALKPGLDSYYDGMFRDVVTRQQRVYDDLAMVNAAAARADAQLHQGSMPIDRAMEQLATRGRMSFPAIRPEAGPEQVLDALRGWSQLSQEVPERRTPTEPPPAPEPPRLPRDVISPEALLELEGGAPGGAGRAVEDDAP